MTHFRNSNFYRFLEPSLERKWHTGLAFAEGLIWWLYSWGAIYLFRELAKAAEQGNLEMLKTVTLGFTLMFVAYWILIWISREWIWPRMYHEINRLLFGKLLRKFFLSDVSATERIGTGKILSLLRSETEDWSEQLMGFWSFLGEYGTFIGISCGIFLVLEPKIGIVFMLMLTGSLAAIIGINRFTHDIRKSREEARLDQSRSLTRLIMSKIEVLQQGKIDEEIRNIQDYEYRLNAINQRMVKFHTGSFNIPQILFGSMRIFLYAGVAYGMVHNVSIPDLLTFLAILAIFEENTSSMANWYKEFNRDIPKIEQLWRVFDGLPEFTGYESGAGFVFEKGQIEIRDASFSYVENTPILDHFSMSFAAGKKTALVGASGGGKTTIMKMIAGYVRPDSGSILVDGQDLRSVALKTYFPTIGYLTQEPSVFDGTVRDNLLYGTATGTSDAEIREALEKSECHFVFDFPDGLETEIGEKGIRLSGGQRQRLAIAKIFLKNPKIVLLDEPTSALDSFSEEKISKALRTLFAGRTVIIIAHRLQTVREADEIFVVEGGKILESGTHDTLVASG